MAQRSSLDAAVALANTSSLLYKVNEAIARLTAAIEDLTAQLPPVIQVYGSEKNSSTATTVASNDRLTTATTLPINSSNQTPAAPASATTPSQTQTPGPATMPPAVSLSVQILTPAEVEARIAHYPEASSFYLVAHGLQPGVYDTLAEASAYTTGVANASMRKVNVKSVALAQYITKKALKIQGLRDLVMELVPPQSIRMVTFGI